MLLFKTLHEFRAWRARATAAGRNIGFAPTMGALHDGHLELVRMSKRAGDAAVVSIFVNPTQFNDPKDLEKYPRTPGRDLDLLCSADCDAVLMPEVHEVYPPGVDLSVRLDFGLLDKVMEGAFRPGHFQGMATVVKRLLDMVEPAHLYMGQKDYQQFSIVRDMIRQLRIPTRLVMCPTVREPDGLAMSSRNVRLSPEMRATAPVIHQALQFAAAELPRRPAAGLEAEALRRLEAAGLKPEYFEIVDGVTLQRIQNWPDAEHIAACTAAWAGDVRLIDNVVIK